ncbi:hypothetical protein M3Y97_01100100 [Aphelenchoides bicaudatus]|nr:hypothetical protein M3Y97_01100100 [Aphelenchoides bicaudatus]
MVSKFLIIALLPLIALCEDITFSDNTIGGDLSIQNDIIVTGNTVGEDIIIGGYDDGTGDGEGGLFGDGCSVIGNSSVHECDGTSRLMTAMEKKRVNVRLARMQRSKRNMKSKSKKPLRKTRRDMNRR